MAEAVTPSEVLARRVREIRRDRGWTGEQLGERMEAFGLRGSRQTVSALEKGTRGVAGIEKLIGLAVALDTTPVHLMVPPDDNVGTRPGDTPEMRVRLIGDVAVTPYVARKWWRGEIPLPGQDAARFRANAREVGSSTWPRLHGSKMETLEERVVTVRRAISEEDVATALNDLRTIIATATRLHDEIAQGVAPTYAEVQAFEQGQREDGA